MSAFSRQKWPNEGARTGTVTRVEIFVQPPCVVEECRMGKNFEGIGVGAEHLFTNYKGIKQHTFTVPHGMNSTIGAIEIHSLGQKAVPMQAGESFIISNSGTFILSCL